MYVLMQHVYHDRLTHNPQKNGGVVIVQCPLAAHDNTVNEFSHAINPAIVQLPINSRLFHLHLHQTFNFRSAEGFSATPDLSFVLMPVTEAAGDFHLLGILECAFTQASDGLYSKIRKMLQTRPEIVFVVVIIVDEARAFRSPQEGSEAWNAFSVEEDCREILPFLNYGQPEHTCRVPTGTGSLDWDSDDEDEDEVFELDPVWIAGHQWCNITSVKYRVWVKNDAGDVIDIDSDDGAIGVSNRFLMRLVSFLIIHFILKTLYPTIAMHDVNAALVEGLSKMKAAIVNHTKTLRPNSNTHKLEAAQISLSVKWQNMRRALKAAANLTAFTRYQAWYLINFRGTKRALSDAEEFRPEPVPSESNNSSDNVLESIDRISGPVTRSQSRGRKAQRLG